MNEHLQERFGRSRNVDRRGVAVAKVWILPPRLNLKVREYFDAAPTEGGAWLSKPEIPTTAEILDLDTDSAASSDVIELEPNRPKGAWDSKEQYLSTHYELYREDALRGLREAVSMVRCTPAAVEDAFNGKVGIYEKVSLLVTARIATSNAYRSTSVVSHSLLAVSPCALPSVLSARARKSYGNSQSA